MNISQVQNNKKLLFAYGSMKKGFDAEELLSGCEMLAACITVKKMKLFPNIDYLYPYLFDEVGDFHISGELYEVDEKTFKEIDEYEGVDAQHYIKGNIVVIMPDGQEKTAVTYFAGPHINKTDYDIDFPCSEWTMDHEWCGKKMVDYLKS